MSPENTLAAITRAVVAGADMVEVDVQRSKDGVPVLIHDTTLVRTTNARRVFPRRAPWHVGDFTYEELRRLDAGSWKSPELAGERLPTLAEAMEAVWAAHPPSYVERVRARGMACQVWTVNRVSALERALRMGVDGVITNRPDVLARVATQRRSAGV